MACPFLNLLIKQPIKPCENTKPNNASDYRSLSKFAPKGSSSLIKDYQTSA